jgi:hypothetical protein
MYAHQIGSWETDDVEDVEENVEDMEDVDDVVAALEQLVADMVGGMDLSSLEHSCSHVIQVDGVDVYPSSILSPTSPMSWQQLAGCPEALAGCLLSEAVDMCHMAVLGKMKGDGVPVLSLDVVLELREAVIWACLWGSLPPIRWGALSTSHLVASTPANNSVMLAEDNSCVHFTISDTKRTKLQAPSTRHVLSCSVPTSTLGGKVMELWLTVGRPYLVHSCKVDDGGVGLPFLLAPTGQPMGQQAMVGDHLLPKLLGRCQQEGWGQLKLHLAHELLPCHQYMFRRLYGNLIHHHSNSPEVVKARVRMMDTSKKMLKDRYIQYPISMEAMELLEQWAAMGFSE